jgi:hypothetical protein
MILAILCGAVSIAGGGIAGDPRLDVGFVIGWRPAAFRKYREPLRRALRTTHRRIAVPNAALPMPGSGGVNC